MNQQEMNNTFKLISLSEIEDNRYYIRYDGEIFDNKTIKFIIGDKLELTDKLGNIIYCNKNKLLLKTFLNSIYSNLDIIEK